MELGIRTKAKETYVINSYSFFFNYRDKINYVISRNVMSFLEFFLNGHIFKLKVNSALSLRQSIIVITFSSYDHIILNVY